jgi:putative PIG3 family NAD(P)H quinone oxidoreductase
MSYQYIHIEDPDTLTLNQADDLTCASDEVVIDVAYAGINRADVLQRMGFYPPPEDASPVMGLEVSGTVRTAGASSGFSPGERVCALVHGGGYATQARAKAACTLRVPHTIDMKVAACLPEAFLTVWYNVVVRAGLKDGETLLVHGGTSGIGNVAVQLGKAMNCRVIATAGSSDKCQLLSDIGTDIALNYNEAPLTEQCAQHDVLGHVDVVLDMVGGDFEQFNLECLAVDGRIACIGLMRGGQATIDLTQLLMKRATLTGSTLRRLTHEEKARCFREVDEQLMPLVENGHMRPLMDKIFDLKDALAAQTYMSSGAHAGKLLLSCA